MRYDESGQSLLEYALVVAALVVLAVMVGWTLGLALWRLWIWILLSFPR